MKTLNILLSMLTFCFIFVSCDTKTTETGSDAETDQQTTVASTTQTETKLCACEDGERYSTEDTEGGGLGFTKDQILPAIELYRENNKGRPTGFHISKQALDSLFCNNKTANGIWIDLINEKDIVGYEGDDSLTIVVSAKKNPHSKIRMVSGMDAFVSQGQCPNMCFRFDQTR